MASQLVIVLWTDHPADNSLASDLAQLCAAQVYRSTSQLAAVVSATSEPLEVHQVTAAVDAFAASESPEVAAPVVVPAVTPLPAAPSAVLVTPEPDAVPPVPGTYVRPVDVVVEPQPTNPDGSVIPTPDAAPVVVTPDPAVAQDATAASSGLATVPDPSTPLIDSDEHMAVLVKLFAALTPEQKAKLDEEVHTMEDAHAALEAIYAPLAALETPVDTQAPPAS